MRWGRRDWNAELTDGLQVLGKRLGERLSPDGWLRPDLDTGSVLLLHRPVDNVLVGTLELNQASFAGPYPWPFRMRVDLGVGLAERTAACALATMESIASLWAGPSISFDVADQHSFARVESGVVEFVRSHESFWAQVGGPADVDRRLQNEIAALVAAGDGFDLDQAHYRALLRLLLLSGFAPTKTILAVLAEYDSLPNSDSGDEYRQFAQSVRRLYA